LWYAQEYSPMQITDKIMFLTCKLHYTINLKQTVRRKKIRGVLRGTTLGFTALNIRGCDCLSF
jgi:hypothetical protein